MIRTIRLDRPDPGLERVAKANEFSLHAGVSCEGHQRDKRKRLCWYIARPALAIPRLSLTSAGKVVYTLPGWHHASGIRPGEFRCTAGGQSPMAWAGYTCQTRQRDAANRQPGRPHLSRVSCRNALGSASQASIQHKHRSLQPLGGSVRVIACIGDQDVIDHISAHLRDKKSTSLAPLTPPSRAPRRHCLFSQGRNPQLHNSMSKDKLSKRVVPAGLCPTSRTSRFDGHDCPSNHDSRQPYGKITNSSVQQLDHRRKSARNIPLILPMLLALIDRKVIILRPQPIVKKIPPQLADYDPVLRDDGRLCLAYNSGKTTMGQVLEHIRETRIDIADLDIEGNNLENVFTKLTHHDVGVS